MELHHHSVDRGWSWVVCGAAFITHMLTVGFSYAIGVYYVEFLEVFQESMGVTAWISSLNYGVLCGIGGPMGSLIIHRYGHRTTMFIGGIIAALGLFVCSFATSLYTVLISFGLITGLGSGLAYTSAVVVISVYYMRLRPLALGLSLAGGGIGNICFPWISSALINRYGWRGALLITSALLLHICVAAALIMKPRRTKIRNVYCTENEKLEKATDNYNSEEYERTATTAVTNSNSYSNNSNNTRSNKKEKLEKRQDNDNNEENEPGVTTALTNGNNTRNSKSNSTSNNSSNSTSNNSNSTSNNSNNHCNNTKKSVVDVNHNRDSVKQLTVKVLLNFHFMLLLINTTMFLFGTAVVFTHIMAFASSMNVPPALGSLMISALGFSALLGRLALSSLSQLPTINTIVLYIFAVFLCGVSIVLLAVWTSPSGLFTCSCTFGFFCAAFGPTVAECACLITGPKLFNFAYGYLMVIMGLGWLLGAPAAGWFYATLKVIKLLNFAYGYLMVIMGLGWLLGAPAAGALYDMTQHYPNSFYLGGFVTMAGALVMIPVAVSSLRENSNKRKHSAVNEEKIPEHL